VINVGLIGYGYWGRRLARNIAADPRLRLASIIDERQARREEIARQWPGVTVAGSPLDAIGDPSIDAVFVATPVGSHFEIAHAALGAGKHVFVEKPLCTSVEEGERLIELAARKRLVLMVDHTFLMTGSVQKIEELCRSGQLGTISYYDAMRVNLGLFQPDVNVMWDLAPHDLSIMFHLLREEPVHLEANGYCHVNSTVPDIAYLTLYFPSNIVAHLNLSWMSPVKVRRTAIGGSSKMLVWDDLNREERIKIYNSGISFQPEKDREMIIPSYRIGDIASPRVSEREALSAVTEHFAQVVHGETASIMSGEDGLRVVRTLVSAQECLDHNIRTVNERWAGSASAARRVAP